MVVVVLSTFTVEAVCVIDTVMRAELLPVSSAVGAVVGNVAAEFCRELELLVFARV